MRDEYGRITPDFKAWEKLGYHLVDIHAETYTFTDSDNPCDFTNIVAEYDTDYTENGLPEYTKEHFFYPNSELEPFTPDELNQIKKDIDNFRFEYEKIVLTDMTDKPLEKSKTKHRTYKYKGKLYSDLYYERPADYENDLAFLVSILYMDGVIAAIGESVFYDEASKGESEPYILDIIRNYGMFHGAEKEIELIKDEK